MPWSIKRNFKDCNGYAVVKDGTDEIEGCHSSRSNAEAQQRALYASESDEDKEYHGERRNEVHNIWEGAFSPKEK